MSASLAKYFPTTDLSKIGDDITDGLIDDILLSCSLSISVIEIL
nr:hypothetical protein [Proteus mirabilis]